MGSNDMSDPRFRFGVVAAQSASGDDWAAKARQVEMHGYSTLVVPDGLAHVYAPLPALVAAAAATTSLRLGTYVIDNDYRHPVMLAKEAATVDFLSGGRLELGVGAGRPNAAADNAMLGRSFDSGGTRVERLVEALSIIKPLLAGEQVSFSGAHYLVTNAVVSPGPKQNPVPLLLAGSQRRMLRLAAREADIIALGVGPDATEDQVAERVDWIREAAGKRFDHMELNVHLMAVAGQLPRYLRMNLGDRAVALVESNAIPILKGTVDQMSDRLEWLRERFGISYIMVSDELMEALAPVVERLAGR